MNTVTLWQPYAGLIAAGAKTIETRSWAPHEAAHMKPLYIHAAASAPAITRGVIDTVSWMWARSRPRGAIVARCLLTGWAQVKRLTGPGHPGVYPIAEICIASAMTSPQARAHEFDIGRIQTDGYGDYTPGRWLWMLDDIEKIVPPIPAKGRQRIWQWTPPTETDQPSDASPYR